jgi:hypothetical protein
MAFVEGNDRASLIESFAVPSACVTKLLLFPPPSIGVKVTGFWSEWRSNRL